MKKTVLFPTILSALFLGETLKASFLDVPSQMDCSQYTGAELDHCRNLKACAEHTTDSGQIEYLECANEAHAAYVKAKEGAPLQADSESMLTDPIVTELADSSYGNPQRDKGYKFSHEGD